MEESKAERFLRIAEPRVNRACKAIRLVANLASSGYESTESQVEAMFAAMQPVGPYPYSPAAPG